MAAFDPATVTTFWREAGYEKWFNGGDAFDVQCRDRFADMHHAAARRELEYWIDSAEGALALLILLDQIPRNIYRGSGHAFATDPLARHYAQQALDAGFDQRLEPTMRAFVYLPFEHSEAMADQDRSVHLFEQLAEPVTLKYAIAHRDVIQRFGRFPHRNRALGRVSTVDEQAYLDAGGGFG